MRNTRNKRSGLALLIAVLVFSGTLVAQTTQFTYQGSLKDGANPANGNYDIEVDIFDAITGGNYFNTITASNVPVVNGTFSLNLDSGASVFPGGPRFLQIKVRQSGSPTWIVLNPRQPVTSSPYAVQSLNASNAVTATNATQLGGVAANQFVQTTDPRLSDARPPTPGSDLYIRNMPIGTGQPNSNFWISGVGRADVIEADEYRVFSSRILAGTTNGSKNLLVGIYAGLSNGTGTSNSFIGHSAGRNDTTGSGNTFAGVDAGMNNTTGSNNSYFGTLAGRFGNVGNFNSFFGHRSGENTTGNLNTFVGTGAGLNITSGSSNVFVGHDAGNGTFTQTSSFNVAIGANARVQTGSNSAAIGANAIVDQSNSIVLGGINGQNGATADTNVGIGTIAPASRLHVNGTVRVTNGAVYIANPNTVIITSPNGACWGLTVNNSGALATFPVTPCP